MSKYRIPSDYVNEVSRNNHNIGAGEIGSVHPGLAIPVKTRRLKAGDRVRGNIETLVQSQPFIGPLMNGFDIVTIATFTPDSVMYGWINNGRTFTPEEMMNFDYWVYNSMTKLPVLAPVINTSSTSSTKLRKLGFYNYNANSMGTEDADSWLTTGRGKDTQGTATLPCVGRGGLWDWLGVPPGATPPALVINTSNDVRPDYTKLGEFMWPINGVVSYLLSCIYYFRNIQEEQMYHTLGVENMSDTTVNGFGDVFCRFDPNDAINSIESLHYNSRTGTVYNYIDVNGSAPTNGFQSDAKNVLNILSTAGLSTYGGLISVRYSPDLFNNIIKHGEAPSIECPVIETSDGAAVAIPEFRHANKLQLMMDRLFASGGRFGDVYRTLFGRKGDVYNNKPDFLGAWKSSINPQNVVAQSAGTGSDGIVDLAQMAARIDRWNNYDGQEYVDYTTKEDGTLQFITVIMPKPFYNQGLNPDLLVKSWADEFNPELNGEGFQSVPRSRYSLLPNHENWFSKSDSANPNSISVGDEVAWSWLKTDFSRLHGDFSAIGLSQYWTLHRNYTRFNVTDGGIDYFGDTITSYINPMDYQYLFAIEDYQQANFNLLANVNITVTNSVSKNYMPFMSR